jgi:sulfate permease, SulP family
MRNVNVTTQVAAAPGMARAVATGIVVACLSLIFSVSFASAIFAGPLAEFRDAGISMAITGSIVYAFASALTGTVPGTWWGNQTSTVVLLAIGAAGIVAAMPEASPATLFATVAVFIALSTFLAGAVLFAIGRAGLGQQAKFMPYPVIGGFLSVTGFFLIVRGADLATGNEAGLRGLLSAGVLVQWLPYVALAAAVALLGRRLVDGAALLIGVILYGGGFIVYLWISGTTLTEAQAAGLLLTAESPARGLFPVVLQLAQADFAVISGQIWTIGAISLLTILGIVMNISALEVQMGQSFRLNREMANAGIANMVAATGCGFVGYHSSSMYQLSRSISRVPVPAIGLTGGAVMIGVMVAGTGFLSYLPKGLFALVLFYLGIELLWRWLVVAWREMPHGDYVIIVAILATAVAFDFVVAIVLGTIAASILFTLAYSRLDVVRNRVSGRLRLSPTERSERDIATLVAHGHQTLVFELQGYLFFGTANGLFDRVAAEITADDADIKTLLVDFRRVEGMDVSASFVLARLADMAVQNGVRIAFTGVSPTLRERLGPAGRVEGLTFHPTLADGLQRVEDRVLAENGGPQTPADPPSAFGQLLRDATTQGLPLIESRRDLAEGEVVYAQGDPGDGLAYLVQGRLSAWVTLPDGSQARVASFLPGAVVGEIAFSAGSLRTASVIADEPCTILSVTRDSLNAAAALDSDVATRFHACLARLLAERLGRTTALFFAIEG